MAWTFSTTSEAGIKQAGANVNSTIVDDATQLTIWSDHAEADICAQANYDCVTNFSKLTSYGKLVTSFVHDCMIAQNIIDYEPEAIGTIGAKLRLNYLQNRIAQGMNKLSDNHTKKYLGIKSL